MSPSDAGDLDPHRRPPEALLAFVALFNRGAYWESHEALEDAWRETGSDFYQGLIIFASAFVHADRGNRHGVRAQLDKAEAYLAPYRPAHLGIDVDALFRHAARCRRALREAAPAPGGPAGGREERNGGGGEGEPGGGEEGEERRGAIPVPRLRLEPDPALVRGDEPELET